MALFPKRQVHSPAEAPADYWMSYSDVMAGLIFMFILLLVLIMVDFRYQSQQVAVQEQENQAMRMEIDSLLGVKEDIIAKLRLEFGDRIQIDTQTGAITFSDNVFFEYGSALLSEAGAEQLQDFIPRYMSVLLSEQFRPHMAQIIIEGHTDSSGDYLSNLQLSQNRALAVATYILGPEFPTFPEQQDLRFLMTANGRSFSHLKMVNGVEDASRSRRVEFKFRLRDEEAVQRVRAMLDGEAQGQ